jgi:hypothetical protein
MQLHTFFAKQIMLGIHLKFQIPDDEIEIWTSNARSQCVLYTILKLTNLKCVCLPETVLIW